MFAQTIAQTMLVKVEIQENGDTAYSIIPAYAKNGMTKRFEGEEAKQLFYYMNEISTKDCVDGEGNVKQFQK